MSRIVLFDGSEAKSEYKRISLLHKQAISDGFLAGLNYQVLIHLYRTMAISPYSMLWVSIGDNNEIQGFISLSLSTSKLYKQFILRRSLFVIPYLIPKILSIAFIRKIYEVLVYPAKSVNITLPEVELLNFCVDESLRGKNIGSKLFLEVEDELKSRQIRSLKIVTGENQEGAQNFYEKRGAYLLMKQEIHKGTNSLIYQYDIQ